MSSEAEVYAWLHDLELQARGAPPAGNAPPGVAQGSIGYGAAGPTFLDAFQSKRAPNPTELVNAYKSVAYACIQLNANGVARVPLRLYVRTGRGMRRSRRPTRPVPRRLLARFRGMEYLRSAMGDNDDIEEVTEHPFLDAFANPNPHFDGNLMVQYLARCLDAIGSAYLYPVRPDASYAASELWPLHAQYVLPIKGQGHTVLAGYTYFGQPYGPDELVRIRTTSLRDPYLSAFAPLHACFEQLGLGDYYTAVVESILKSGARPSMMVGPKDAASTFGDVERKRLEVDINNRFAAGRSGHIWVTTGSFDAQPLSFPPADLAGLEISKNARLLVANCFDVPISLLQAEDSNRAVAEAGTYQHQYYAIEPRCVAIAAALTHQLARPVDDRLFFAFDDPVSKNNAEEAKVFDMYLKNGTLCPDEVRAEIGYEPATWDGTEPYLPGTLVQPSQAIADREQKKVDAANAAEQLKQGKGPDGEDLPEPKPDPAETPDKEEEDPERALRATLTRVLSRLEGRLDEDDDAGPDDGEPGPGDPPQPAPGRPAGGRRRRSKHLWAADRRPDLGGAEGLVPGATGEGAGDDPGDRGAPAAALPGADGLRPADGAGDDPDPVGLLGRGREVDAGAAGAGPGRMASDGPPPPADDPAVEPEVLPGDERDDPPGPQHGAGPAEE